MEMKRFGDHLPVLTSMSLCVQRTTPGGIKRQICQSFVTKAYLLIFWSGVYDVVHQYREKLSHSSHASSKCAVRSTTTRQLSGLAGLVYPLSGYRVYNVQYS